MPNIEEVMAALHRFESATIKAWCYDTEDSYTDRDRKVTKDAHENARVKKLELISLIQELAKPSIPSSYTSPLWPGPLGGDD